MSKYYTYPVCGFGVTPDPDSVQDHETLEDAYVAFLGDIDVTVGMAETDDPTDIPPMMACADGVVYGHSGWFHVIGKA